MRFDFSNVDAGDYARLRPRYAPDAIDWVVARAGLSRGSRVIDIGAGTGQLAKEFAERGATVWAVEPAANMRRELRATSRRVRVVDGSAEALPMPDGLAHAAVVGQAFHHFEPQAALEEIHRVLVPDGALAVFWVAYPSDDPTVAAVDAIVSRYASDDDPQRRAVVNRRAAFRGHSLFSSVEVRAFPWWHRLDARDLAALLATSSDIASIAPPSRRRSLLAELRAYSHSLPDALEVPMTTEVHLCFRR